MHYEWTIRALKSGKHVLCEKPLAPTEAQAEEMFKVAEENHVYLMEAFAYQHSPYIAAVRKEIENGTIGDVRYMESAYITSDYDPKNIRMRRDTLGGCTYDLGVYNTSLILRILGDEPAKVRAIASFSEEKIDTLTSAIFEYADGKRQHFPAAWHWQRTLTGISTGSKSRERKAVSKERVLNLMETGN